MAKEKTSVKNNMASWERLSTKRTGVQILPYYHMSGMDGFAKEFYDLCLSVYYAQKTNDFLFIFDMVNPITSDYFYFQNVLKKTQFVRFLPYFPSSGFIIRGRQDLIQPLLDQGPSPDKPSIYEVAKSMFDFQHKLRESNGQFFEKHDIPHASSYRLGIVYSPSFPDPKHYLDKLGDIPRVQSILVYIYCPSPEIFQEFRTAFPKEWCLKSIQTSGHLHWQTNEQKINRYYLEIAELQILRDCPILVGTFETPASKLMGLLEERFRQDPTAFRSLDTKRFAFY